MKLGIIGTGNVGCAIALAAVTRGSAREIVLVNRSWSFRRHRQLL
jgi:L-lactate dehydrogenase